MEEVSKLSPEELEEAESWTADSLVETESPNAGNIKNVEVARAGAHAEKEYRDKKSANGKSLSYDQELAADKAGTKAMGEVVKTKVALDASKESAYELAGKGNAVKKEFVEFQKKVTKSRITGEKDIATSGAKSEDLLHVDGPLKGEIKDPELAGAVQVARSQAEKSMKKSLWQRIKSVIWADSSNNPDSAEAETAMSYIRDKVANKGAQENISPAAIEEAQHAATMGYRYQKQKLTNERQTTEELEKKLNKLSK